MINNIIALIVVFSFKSHVYAELNYLANGDASKEGLVFVHGTPGSHEAFESYYSDSKLEKNFFMVSVDRLGFGESESSHAVTSLQTHGDSITQLLKSHWPQKTFNCIGHSYGGPLCLKLMLEDPKRYSKGVLISGAFNPHRDILKWYNHAAKMLVVKWILPQSLNHSNKEMLRLKKELKKLEPKISQLNKRLLLIHGKKDKIVPYEDSLFLKKTLSEKKVQLKTYKDAGHFLIWKKDKLVKSDIFNFISKDLD